MIQIQLQRYAPHAALEMPDTAARFKPFGDDGLTFGDVIDVINPLHHIPVIGTIYRKLTGDTIDPAIRVAGGALFGGPIGAAFSVAAVVFGAAQKGSPALAADPEGSLALNSGAAQRSQRVAVATAALAEDRGERISDIANSRSLQHVGFMPSAGENHSLRVTSNPQPIRRGGWMVIQAYGPSAPPSSSAEPQHNRGVAVNIAV